MTKTSEHCWKKALTTWEHPEEWLVSFGRETYGVAGSLILQPLSRELVGFQIFELIGSEVSVKPILMKYWKYTGIVVG